MFKCCVIDDLVVISLKMRWRENRFLGQESNCWRLSLW